LFRSVLTFLLFLGSEAFLSREGTIRQCATYLAASKPKKIVIIGGGWAGFSAADALATSKEPVQVELLDASPRGPGGLAAGWRTPKLNRPVEAGLHGFWREYRNTFAAIERIGLSLDNVLTPFTPSILVSKSGRVALAPVLGDGNTTNAAAQPRRSLDLSNPNALLSTVAELLPPPLDVALLSEFDSNNPLTLADRASALGLLGAWADFEQEDPESWKKYDKISADNLFRSVAGVTPRLYEELVSPLLHVLPMTPGYDCSAAAALSCFHVFALQARGAFDVRWCRGTISEKIFNPWAAKLSSTGAVNIRGGSKVTSIEEVAGDDSGRRFRVLVNEKDSFVCDAIVFAVGGTAIKRLLLSSPPLASLPDADGWSKFRGVTCVAVRLFLRPEMDENGAPRMIHSIAQAMKDSPVVVCGPAVGGIPQLSETGFCVYDLQRLQGEFTLSDSTEALGLEVDFFRADDLAAIEDDMEVARITLRAVAAALGIQTIDADSSIVDLSVVRARNAVSHFCVNSESWSPDVRLAKGLYICGDWVDRSGHASWSTEKSVVTARQAISALSSDLDLSCETDIIPAAKDTAQLSALRQVSRSFRKLSPIDMIPPAPWVLLKQLSGQ